MKLKLDRPLVIFDIEATGTDVSTDRIVELCMRKVLPDGTEEQRVWRINPGIPIPEEVTAIHGITDADVASCPTFAELAVEIRDFIASSDLAGYNSNRFDVPMLVEEFLRADVGFDENRRYVDVLRIFTLMEQRNLKAAYRFFCDKELENAHRADADVTATWEVLQAQLERYDELQPEVGFLDRFTRDDEFVDFGRRMIWRDGTEVFNFGKFKGQSVEEVFRKEPQYYDWMMKADFPLHTKLRLKHIKLRMKTAKP